MKRRRLKKSRRNVAANTLSVSVIRF
jgi:hypothetical protein